MRLFIAKPKRVDVLIYDRVGSEFVRRALKKNISWGILDVRGKSINIYPSIPFRFLMIVLKNSINRSVYWRPFSIQMALDLASIQTIKPRVVISFIDNSRRFNLLSRVYSKAEFFAVQNGLRTSEISRMVEYLCVTNFVCFGKETEKRYHDAGCKVGRFIIAGSLKNSLYRESKRNLPEKRYDLCWISQFRPARFQVTMPGLQRGSIRLLEYAQRYSDERGKTLAIACSCKEKAFPYEYQFLRSLIKTENIVLIPNDDNNFSTYKAIDQSEVSLTVNSTVGFEGISRGNKVLFCNFSKDKFFDVSWPYGDGIWALKGDEIGYGGFSKRLDKLFEMEDSQWRLATGEMAQYFIRDERDRTASSVLREEVARCLGSDIPESL